MLGAANEGSAPIGGVTLALPVDAAGTEDAVPDSVSEMAATIDELSTLGVTVKVNLE